MLRIEPVLWKSGTPDFLPGMELRLRYNLGAKTDGDQASDGRHDSETLKAAFDSFPPWAALAEIVLPLILLIPLLMLLRHHYLIFWALFAILMVGFNTATYRLNFRHSIVELRYAHQATTFRERWKMMQPYVLIAAGALAYALAERFVKAIWP